MAISYVFTGTDGEKHEALQCSICNLPELKAWFQILDILIENEDNKNNFINLYCEKLELRLVCDRILCLCEVDPNIVSIDGLFSLVVLNLTKKDPAPCHLKIINNLV